MIGMQRALAEAQQWLTNKHSKKPRTSCRRFWKATRLPKKPCVANANREQRITQEMLEKAHTAQQTGKYKEALQLVETVLEKRRMIPKRACSSGR
jgi:hypothetical protein